MKFSGNRLVINFSTSGAGSLRVELQDEEGNPLPGYTLDDAVRHVGDAISHTVRWKSGRDVGRFQSRMIRLQIIMLDADLYSLRFAGDVANAE